MLEKGIEHSLSSRDGLELGIQPNVADHQLLLLALHRIPLSPSPDPKCKPLQEALDVFLAEQQGEGSEPFLYGWQLVKLLRACNPYLFLWQKKDRIHAYLHK